MSSLAQLMLASEPSPRRVTVAAVIEICAKHYGIAPGLLTEPDGGAGQRQRWIANKRHVAMYLARELTDISTVQIGSIFGGRDHSTVLHACKRVAQRLEGPDLFIRSDVRAISGALGAAAAMGAGDA